MQFRQTGQEGQKSRDREVDVNTSEDKLGGLQTTVGMGHEKVVLTADLLNLD